MKSLLAIILIISNATYAITLEEYITEVTGENDAIKASEISIKAKNERVNESKLLFRPNFFFNGTYNDDKRPTNAPTVMGYQTIRRLYQAGISENFSTGTKVSLSYNMLHTQINGANPGFLPRTNFYDLTPQFEISQSLWRNFFGSEDRANAAVMNGQLRLQSFQEIFKKKQLLTQAENVYYRLLIAQKAVRVQEESLERARKLKEWNLRRVQNRLADPTDLLQAESNVQNREIELENAKIELKSALIQFNSVRGREEIDESIALDETSLDSKKWVEKEKPATKGAREDVLMAFHQASLSEMQAQLGLERNRPTLEVFGTYARNGRATQFSGANTQSFTNDHPYSIVGVRFVTPLDFNTTSKNKDSYNQEKVASKLNYERKLLEAKKEQEELDRRYDQFQKRLDLALKMEAIQKRKLDNEKDLYSRGRTTTFQVLQFEQDFANSQLLKLRHTQELIATYNQLKLLSGDQYE